MKIYEGRVERERVRDTGYATDFELCIYGDSVEGIFYEYEGKRVKVTIEILPDEEENDGE